jgi:hypothetical protein
MWPFNIETKEITGCFVEVICCTKCDWFDQPWHVKNPLNPQRIVCPNCGGGLSGMVGQYLIRAKHGFFYGTSNEYIGFIRKDNEPDVPKPQWPLRAIE